MFWLDEVIDQILAAFPDKKEFIIRDEKTLSGRVHVGSLRGVVIHGLVAQALNERGKKAQFLFEFNDADPMDGLPIYLDQEKFRPHMGKPLKNIPSPDGKTRDYPTFFGEEFLKVINKIGFFPEIVRASQQYENGTYDKWIEKALQNKEKIRSIYHEVSGSEKSEDWYPLQIICEKCGKVGTTKVTNYDGKEVEYHCMPNMVEWGVGCDYKGKVSPFWSRGGRGKLPWKVEWPVKWLGYKVDIEGGGKDHCAAGGSRDVGERICREVFQGTPPFNIPYEFFLFEGAKMSSSKGMGATAHEMSEALPSELLRFLLTRTRPQTPINFNADGETVPRLFDDFDKTARVEFGEEEGHEDLKRTFHFSTVSVDSAKKRYLPRFSRIAFFVQLPHLAIEEEITRIKGDPLTPEDHTELSMRTQYAKKWLSDYAPESHKFKISEKEIPEKVGGLSGEQKKFLKELANLIEKFEKENTLKDAARGEALHAKIHEHRKKSPLDPREGFSAIYISLIGKDSGPQAGWFLEALDPQFVIQRFRAAANLASSSKNENFPQKISQKNSKDHFNVRIDPAVQKIFGPLFTKAFLIKNITVRDTSGNPEAENFQKEKNALIASLKLKEVKKNSVLLQEYKNIIKKMGLDPIKRKPAPVALIDRLVNGKEMPSVNNVTDICNLMMIKHQVAIHAWDGDKITFPITLRPAHHGETFQPANSIEPLTVNIQKGELVYADASGKILSQDYNHHDSKFVQPDRNTKNLFILIDGNSAADKHYTEIIADKIIKRLA